MAFRSASTATYTFASGSTGSTVDLGANNNYRYINATNVYNKGKADGTASKRLEVFIMANYNTSFYVVVNLNGETVTMEYSWSKLQLGTTRYEYPYLYFTPKTNLDVYQWYDADPMIVVGTWNANTEYNLGGIFPDKGHVYMFIKK